jgi:hypothetical protein
MKPIVVEVEIWAISDPELEKADVIFVKQFEISNFKIPLPDIISKLSSESVEKEYPGHEYVGYEVISYS